MCVLRVMVGAGQAAAQRNHVSEEGGERGLLRSNGVSIESFSILNVRMHFRVWDHFEDK